MMGVDLAAPSPASLASKTQIPSRARALPKPLVPTSQRPVPPVGASIRVLGRSLISDHPDLTQGAYAEVSFRLQTMVRRGEAGREPRDNAAITSPPLSRPSRR